MHRSDVGPPLAWLLAATTWVAAGCASGGGGAGGATSSSSTDAATGVGGGGVVCPPGYRECDGDPATLCEAAIALDVEHCGGCDVPCAGDEVRHLEARCVEGTCRPVCVAGWVDCNGDPADGCEAEGPTCGTTTLVADVTAPTGLAVDDEHVYFGSRGLADNAYADGYVARVPKGGGEVTVMAAGQPRPLNMTIDGELLVWTLPGTQGETDGAVLAMPLDRSSAPWVIAGSMETPGNPVILGDDVIFTARDGTIRRAARDGSEADAPSVLLDGIADPHDLTADGETLFWADGGGEASPAVLGRLDLPDGEPVVLAAGITQPSYRLGIGRWYVFLGSFDQLSLFRVPIEGGAPELLAFGLGSPNEVVVDEGRERVYFTTGPGGVVASVSSRDRPTAVEGVAVVQRYPSYLAQDDDHLYWTDGYLAQPGGAIRRAVKPGGSP